MALIICPECKKNVSDKAECCPHCGCPLSAEHEEQEREYRSDETESASEASAEKNTIDEESNQPSDMSEQKSRKKHQISSVHLKKLGIVISVVIFFAAVIILFYEFNLSPKALYKKGEQSFKAEDYEAAIKYYEKIQDYEDSEEKLIASQNGYHYNNAILFMGEGEYSSALEELQLLGDYQDASDRINECNYQISLSKMRAGEYESSIAMFEKLSGYKDSVEKIKEEYYLLGKERDDAKKYSDAIDAYRNSEGYEDANTLINNDIMNIVIEGDYDLASQWGELCAVDTEYYHYANGKIAERDGDIESAINEYEKSGNILDSKELYTDLMYQYAKQEFEKRDFSVAIWAFNKISDYKESEEYMAYANLLYAEEWLQNGQYSTAKAYLNKVSDGTKYGNISKEDLWQNVIELEEKAKPFNELAGKWISINGESRATESGGYYSHWWHREYGEGDRSIQITCNMNADGTCRVKLTGSIFIYTKYSSYKEGLEWELKDIGFEQNMSSPSGTIKIDDRTSVTISSDKITANYKYVDKSQNVYYNYTYKTDITYKKAS